MINTFRYGGHKPFVKDEAIHALELPPREILEMKGPFLQVTITHLRIISEDMRRGGTGKKFPLFVVR